jgi:hypothetical protein
MATDNDLAALMPDPRRRGRRAREAAIAEAMRRFDGEPPSPPPITDRPKPALPWWRQPQLAALASIALVVTISVPVWWFQRIRLAEVLPPRPAAAPDADLDAQRRSGVDKARSVASPAAPESALDAPAGPPASLLRRPRTNPFSTIRAATPCNGDPQRPATLRHRARLRRHLLHPRLHRLRRPPRPPE